MFEKSVFENLKRNRDRARDKMNEAFEEKERSGKKLNELNGRLNVAWNNLQVAKGDMNRAYEAMEAASSDNSAEWARYHERQKSISLEIEEAKRMQQRYHEDSQELFQRSRDAYRYGDKAGAAYYSRQANEKKSDRDKWADEVRRLIDESKSLPRPTGDNSDYRRRFNSLRDEYRSKKEAYNKIKDEHAAQKSRHQAILSRFFEARDEFNSAKAELEQYRGKTKKAQSQAQKDYEWRREELLRKGLSTPIDAEKHHKGKTYTQHEDSECRIDVISGYSRKYGAITTDIRIYDKKSSTGEHWHIVIDEYGREITRHWVKGHGHR